MRPKSPVPTLYHHRASNQDAVVLREPDGKRRTVYLGEHDSPEAKRRYREVLAEHLAGKPVAATVTTLRQPPPSDWPTVGQLCGAFLLHADRYYVDPDGQPTREVENIRSALRKLLDQHRDTPTDRFGVRELGEVRQAMIDARDVHEKGRQAPSGLSRGVVNARVRRIKAVFKWGVTQKLVPAMTWHELNALTGLRRGRAGAPERPRVEEVTWPIVEATLPHLVPTIRDAVLVQWWCGCRPAELLQMTRRTLDTSGEVWLFRPPQHKGLWRDRERIVALGPKAVAILKPRLTLELDRPLFNGRDAWNECRAAKRAARTSAITTQTRIRDRKAEAHAKQIGEQMTVHEYRRHLHRAADKAEVPRWSPHRLRHAAGTRVVREAGIEQARALLGHSDSRVTRRYTAGADAEIAAATARQLG